MSTEININIKPQNRGKFGRHCKGLGMSGVTQECIRKSKQSKSPSVRKMAVFADNSRKWNK